VHLGHLPLLVISGISNDHAAFQDTQSRRGSNGHQCGLGEDDGEIVSEGAVGGVPCKLTILKGDGGSDAKGTPGEIPPAGTTRQTKPGSFHIVNTAGDVTSTCDVAYLTPPAR